MSSSVSEGLCRIRVHISIVNMVELELKIDVKELIKAAIITANIIPERPLIAASKINTWNHVTI